VLQALDTQKPIFVLSSRKGHRSQAWQSRVGVPLAPVYFCFLRPRVFPLFRDTGVLGKSTTFQASTSTARGMTKKKQPQLPRHPDQAQQAGPALHTPLQQSPARPGAQEVCAGGAAAGQGGHVPEIALAAGGRGVQQLPVRQLWSTRMQDMQDEAASCSDVGACVCCTRPVLVTDFGTRKMTFCRMFVDMLQDCNVDQDSLLYKEQRRLLQQGFLQRFVLICFICLPSWKKSITQYEAGRKVDTPSLFMHKSNQFLHDSAVKTDKLSLLKYVLCVSSEISILLPAGQGSKAQARASKIYHPLRTSDFVVLEAIIVFFKHLFQENEYNVRAFSRAFCHFQIVSIVRWHVSGFPLIMQQNRQTQDLRKALRGTIGQLYHAMWGFSADFVAMQGGSVLHGCAKNAGSECAACMHEGFVPSSQPTFPDGCVSVALKAPKKKKSYDTFFLKEWNYIYKQIAHTAECFLETAPPENHRIVCRRHLRGSVLSYFFYRTISHKFPKRFRQRNIRRYYSRLL